MSGFDAPGPGVAGSNGLRPLGNGSGGRGGGGEGGGSVVVSSWVNTSDSDGAAPSRTALPRSRSSRQEDVDAIRSKLAIERSVFEGAMNLIRVFDAEDESGALNGSERDKGRAALRQQVEDELQAARINIRDLEDKIAALGPEESRPVTPSPTRRRTRSPPPAPPPALSFEATFDGFVALLQRLETMQHSNERVKAMDEAVATVNSLPRIKYDLQLEDVIISILSGLAESVGGLVRSGTYRLLRHVIVDQRDVSLLHTRHLSIYLIRSLARGDKHDLEKEQALRLIRTLLALPEAPRAVQPSVIRAVVALAEAPDEKLRIPCLETLGELLLRDVGLLVAGEGLRVVLQALADGPHDFSPYLATAFLFVTDRSETRQYLRPGVDFEVVLAGFAENPGKGSSHEERVKASAKIVTAFCKSWSGLLSLCLNGRQAITSLVNSLKTPSKMLRDTLLDTFAHILNLRRPPWDKGSTVSALPEAPVVSSEPRPNLVDQYLAIVLLVFVEAGLVEALVAVATEVHESSTLARISLLLAEILRLATRILPLSRSTRIQALPRLFDLSTTFDTSDGRLSASAALSAVNDYNQQKDRQQFREETAQARQRSNSVDDPMKRGQRQVDASKLSLGLQIEDAQFRELLLETQVLSTKDHTKWRLSILFELMEGPLLNPRRLDEAMRASKFMRRLVGFFHPFNYRLGDISNTSPDADRIVELGCLTLATLVSNSDGVRYLTEDKLLPQIADCFAQLDPVSYIPPAEVVMSKKRMESTLVGGYFEMIGTLTKSHDGIRLLEQFRIFTHLYRISELRSRDDVVKAMLSNMDYTFDGHPRVLLAKALTSNYKHIRMFATELLAKLARDEGDGALEWQIQLLLTQLYDPSPEVCELAVRSLEEACQRLETLEMVVRMRPTLDHLGDMGVLLLTRFLSTSVGAQYLFETDFIERELDDWYHERNFSYMIQMELLLASAFQVGDSLEPFRQFDGTPPPHFYGELVKTPEGCEILAESGHFPRFAEFIQQHGLEDSDLEVISRLKSVLWAVGHVGASAGGLPFLEDDYIIHSIVEIAEDSSVYSLRGTAYFVLGLISSTLEGAEILEELGWESVCTPLGGTTGICVPVNLAHLVETEPWEPPPWDTPTTRQFTPPTTHLEREALAAIANLSNHILATKASKSLAKLKTRHREVFKSPALFCRALEMISSFHYRQPVRRYILELFDVPLDATMVDAIVAAGEELKLKGTSPSTGEEAGEAGAKWDMPSTTQAILVDGLDGGFTDEEDDSPDEGEMIPLEVLKPMLTIKGFVIN